MNFCPQCGSGRSGKFCARCGFAFEGPAPKAEAVSVVTKRQSIIYGDQYDPENDCFNCGNPKPKRSKTCSLCDQEF